MATLVVRLDPRKLANPDADLRYLLPDLLAERSAGGLRDDGYDYLGEPPFLFLFLQASELEQAFACVLDVVKNIRVLDNDLRSAVVDYGSGSEVKGIHVSLEHAPTYSSIKLLAEDVGLIYIHQEARYVKIDGLSYEYVIQSKDVVDLSLHSDRKSVLLSYRVGEELLDLAIAPRGVLAELLRQTLGSSRSLFLKMQDALKSEEGAD